MRFHMSLYIQDSALMNTFSDSNNAFIILDGFVMGLMKFLDSFYVFDSHARNCSGMPDPNGTAVIMKCSTINILFEYLCDLAFELNTDIFEVVPVEFTEEQKRHYNSVQLLRKIRPTISGLNHSWSMSGV